MSETPVRFGLVGFGAWGQHHANAITVTDGAELVAIAARSDASVEAAQKTYPNAEVCSARGEQCRQGGRDRDYTSTHGGHHLELEISCRR